MIAACLVFFGLVTAETSPASASATAPVVLKTAEQKLSILETQIKKQTPHAQAWFGVWIAIYAALGIGQSILAGVLPAGPQRANYATGAVLSALGLLGHVIFPYEAAFVESKLNAFDASAGPEAKLAHVEELLRSAANQSRNIRGWLNHVLPVAVGAGAFLILWLRYNQLVDGLITFFGSTAISEIRIWSAPQHTARIEKDYDVEKISVRPLLVPGGFGVAATW